MQNVKKIIIWSTLRNVTEVRQFLGMASYYRGFIRNFSTIAKPITNLTKKNEIFHLTLECKESSKKKKLKTILTGPEIMGYPDQDHGLFSSTQMHVTLA